MVLLWKLLKMWSCATVTHVIRSFFFVHFKDSKKRSFISKLPQNFFDSFCKFKIYEVKSKK